MVGPQDEQRQGGVPVAAATLTACLLLIACASSEHRSTATIRPAAGRVGPADFDARDLVSEIKRHVITAHESPSPAQTAVITLGQFTDHTGTKPKTVEEFRKTFERRLTGAGREVGLVFVSEDGRAPVGGMTMHTAVLPLNDDSNPPRWLLRMMIVGIDRRGDRRTLWSDELAMQAP